ncbi:MAG: hypothetical protein UH625_11425 [Muribaculaceae bacterium]|nr:hypothetical protein [Muribaculaceae bacterium]
MRLDYEEIEEYLGGELRRHDYVDLEKGVFLPVRFIGRMMMFAEERSLKARQENPVAQVSIVNKEYSRWIDDMIAQLTMRVVSDMSAEPLECQLIDVEEMAVERHAPLTVTLSGDRGEHIVLDAEDDALEVDKLTDIGLEPDFSRLLEFDLPGVEYLASLFIRGAMALKVELTEENFPGFSDKFFDYFRYDLEQLAPSVLEDLQTICDNRLVSLSLRVK